MHNFFLLNDAFRANSIPNLEKGIYELMEIHSVSNRLDNFLKHNSIWSCDTGHGLFYELFYNIISKKLQGAFSKFIEVYKDYDKYINDENEFDVNFVNDCNCFNGIDFSTTAIPTNRQIYNVTTYNTFIKDCINRFAYETINRFWEYKETIFNSLIFCENVFDQIGHLSINDDRFKLIDNKLKRLNDFTKGWKTGLFNYKAIGLDCSPDTPKRINDTLDIRTILCPNIGKKVFNLHIKWYFGGESFRLYYYPESTNHKVYIGFIGTKSEIGF